MKPLSIGVDTSERSLKVCVDSELKNKMYDENSVCGKIRKEKLKLLKHGLSLYFDQVFKYYFQQICLEDVNLSIDYINIVVPKYYV